MKDDAKKFYPFLEHFEMAIVYNTPTKYLADKKKNNLFDNITVINHKVQQYQPKLL